MATVLNPYITFDGNAREAMETYRDIFGGDLTISTFGEYGQADSPVADKVMHGNLTAPNGMVLMGADEPPGEKHEPGNNIAISLSGTDADELRGYWSKLVEGGQVSVPMEKQMWGDEFGMCTDRFGISWMVNIGQQG
jgi:PhnB protein